VTLLATKAYDPAVAVSKSTAAALAMTALDTVNLRNVFTLPAGQTTALVRLQGTVHGGSATPWFPQILLGVMSGATVVKRLAPAGVPQGSVQAATTMLTVEALFVVDGLVAGSAQTWDAAYGVETIATASALKYGGPNNATVNDAFGAFLFEVWSTGL
jgi:hypothetical protein